MPYRLIVLEMKKLMYLDAELVCSEIYIYEEAIVYTRTG